MIESTIRCGLGGIQGWLPRLLICSLISQFLNLYYTLGLSVFHCFKNAETSSCPNRSASSNGKCPHLHYKNLRFLRTFQSLHLYHM